MGDPFSTPSRPPAHIAVREQSHRPVAVVLDPVMGPAEDRQVLRMRRPTVLMALDVVDVTSSGGPTTTRGAAGLVTRPQEALERQGDRAGPRVDVEETARDRVRAHPRPAS